MIKSVIVAQTHPPVVSHSSSNKVGIINDIVMGQRGALWSPSCTLR